MAQSTSPAAKWAGLDDLTTPHADVEGGRYRRLREVMVSETKGKGEKAEKSRERREPGCAGRNEVRVMWACWGGGKTRE